MADLCTLPEAKSHLNISSSALDADVAYFITVASDLVEKQARRVWRDTTYTDEQHKGGTDAIVLFHSPVKSITSLTNFGSVVGSSEYTLDAAQGLIRLVAGTFVPGEGRVLVTYVAGSTTVPILAKHATLETLRHLWATQRGTVNRNPLSGDDMPAGSTFSLPMRAVELLDKLASVGGIG